MRAPRRYMTEAVVLRHLNYGEADRILTLYTPTFGKLHCIAKGSRRPGSRSGAHLDLFTRCQVLVARGRSLDIVAQAETLEHFPGLRADLLSGSYAHHVAELVDAFAPDRLPNAELYALHLATLRSLNQEVSTMAVRAFELKLLDVSGYRPQLHSCLSCSTAILPEANRFSSSLGGVLCPSCCDEDPQAKDISVNELKVLRYLQTNPDRVLALETLDVHVIRQVERHLHEYITYRLEKRLKSAAVVKRLQRQLAPTSA